MSVPIAVTGWIPKIRIRSGVISEAPPMPVIPTSRPMPNPKSMIVGSMPSAEDVKPGIHRGWEGE